MSGHSLTIKNYKKLIFATVPFISTKLSIFLYFGTYFSKSHTSDVRRGNMTVGFVEISKTCKRARGDHERRSYYNRRSSGSSGLDPEP